MIVAPGPVFAAEGGLDRFVRIPWTKRPDELELRPGRAAWDEVAGAVLRRRRRVMVA